MTRLEDLPLVTGRGRFAASLSFPNQLHMRVVRSNHAHGKIVAIDCYTICDNGPYDAIGDGNSAGRTISLMYQPEAMRWRGVTILTNTPPRGAQRAVALVSGRSELSDAPHDLAQIGIDGGEVMGSLEGAGER